MEKDRLTLINSLINDDKNDKLSILDEHIVKVIQQSDGGWLNVVKEEIFGSVETFCSRVNQFFSRLLQQKTVSTYIDSKKYIFNHLLSSLSRPNF